MDQDQPSASSPMHESQLQSHQLQHSIFPTREALATSVVMHELNQMKSEICEIKTSLSSLSCTQVSGTVL